MSIGLAAILYIGMIFLHIVDDFYLQGILAKMKQKKWWEENAPESLYAADYLIALAIHGLSWATMVLLPFALLALLTARYDMGIPLLVAWVLNAGIHAIVDDAKCNKFKTNLSQDQAIHFAQMSVSFMVLWIIYGII